MFILVLWYYWNRRRVALWELCYLIVLAFIVFTPLSINDLYVAVMPPGTGRVSFLVDLWHFSVLENIILTVPLGMIIKRQRPYWSLVLAGIACGGFIEITQYIISHLWLMNRSSDINDVIANAVGVVIGGVLWCLYVKLIPNRNWGTLRCLFYLFQFNDFTFEKNDVTLKSLTFCKQNIKC